MVILHIFLTLFLGLLPGLLWMWIIFDTKFKGMLLWIFSWLIGWAYIAFGLYIIQFVHHGIGWIERFFLLLIPIIIISIMVFTKKTSFLVLKETLFLKISLLEIKKSYKELSTILRIVLWLLLIYIVWYVVLTFTHNISFPSYHMDSLFHWNMPAVEIISKDGFDIVKDYGNRQYPLFISLYKALVSILSGGGRIEELANIFQQLIFLVFGIFIIATTWQKTKNILYSILPVTLICGLPLIYFQVVDGYLDLTMIVYIVIACWLLYFYLNNKESDYLLLGLLILSISSFLKNDGAFVYIPPIILAFTLILIIKNSFIKTIKYFFSSGKNILIFLFSILFFILPHILFIITNNKSNIFWQSSGIIKENHFHTEIFGYLPNLFIEFDNYNSILILIFLFIIYFFIKRLYKTNLLFLFLSSFFLFLHMLFTVFIFSGNYIRFLNQTASNRMFTMVFVLFLSFIGFYISEAEKLGRKK